MKFFFHKHKYLDRKEIILRNKNNYSLIDTKKSNKIINDKLIKEILNLNIGDGYICLYNSFGFEPNIYTTLKYIIKKYNVCMPCVEKENVLRKINDVNYKYVMHKHIKQPSKKNKNINPNDVKLLIVPCVAYNKCYRLGWGTNFYNEMFKNVKCKKVILAFNFQHYEFEKKKYYLKFNKIITN